MKKGKKHIPAPEAVVLKNGKNVFQGPPFGNVVSFSNQIHVTAPQMGMTLGYFGRGEGTDFDSYKSG